MDYIPSLFVQTSATKKTPHVLKQKIERQNRIKDREEKRDYSAAALALLQLQHSREIIAPGVEVQATIKSVDHFMQTDLDIHDVNSLSKMNNKQDEYIKSQEKLIENLLNVTSTVTVQTASLRDVIEGLQSKI